MPRARKYDAWTESAPFTLGIDHVSIHCPLCTTSFVDIPTSRLSRKGAECRKHMLAAHPGEEPDAEPAKRPRRVESPSSPTDTDDQSADTIMAMRIQVAQLSAEKTLLEMQLASRDARDAEREAETAALRTERDDYRARLDELLGAQP